MYDLTPKQQRVFVGLMAEGLVVAGLVFVVASRVGGFWDQLLLMMGGMFLIQSVAQATGLYDPAPEYRRVRRLAIVVSWIIALVTMVLSLVYVLWP